MYAFCIFGLVYKQRTKREKTKEGRIYLKMKYERNEFQNKEGNIFHKNLCSRIELNRILSFDTLLVIIIKMI